MGDQGKGGPWKSCHEYRKLQAKARAEWLAAMRKKAKR